MFDITSSKLLLLGIVALLVVGPKELPALLRTIGKYVGIIRRQAAEFRTQFDDAMRETELAELKKQVESVGQEAEASFREAEAAVDKDVREAQMSVDKVMESGDPKADPFSTHDADGLPLSPSEPQSAAARAAAAVTEKAGA
jgi:sec-independent protein translocase protein TatB